MDVPAHPARYRIIKWTSFAPLGWKFCSAVDTSGSYIVLPWAQWGCGRTLGMCVTGCPVNCRVMEGIGNPAAPDPCRSQISQISHGIKTTRASRIGYGERCVDMRGCQDRQTRRIVALQQQNARTGRCPIHRNSPMWVRSNRRARRQGYDKAASFDPAKLRSCGARPTPASSRCIGAIRNAAPRWMPRAG